MGISTWAGCVPFFGGDCWGYDEYSKSGLGASHCEILVLTVLLFFSLAWCRSIGFRVMKSALPRKKTPQGPCF